MDSQRDTLLGLLATRNGLLEASRLAETSSGTIGEPLGDRLVRLGLIDDHARTVLELLVDVAIKHHGGDVAATVDATFGNGDGSSLNALSAGVPGNRSSASTQVIVDLGDAPANAVTRDEGQDGHVVRITAIGTTGSSATRERYSRTRLHARGGIGQVWLAKDSDLGREVALKELRPEREASANATARFLEEARITGQLEHPGIVPIYELAKGPDGTRPFYTMRFVRGRTLSEAIQEYHDQREAGTASQLDRVSHLNAFISVCNAVGYAHARGVIHRDLKGQNIVLGDFGEVMVLDWGLAKFLDQPENDPGITDAIDPIFEAGRHATRQGQVLGTPAYMAPEQAQGRLDLLDRRTDVYGLGAILYEILTGVPPFTGSNTQDLLRRVREELPPAPRLQDPQVPHALEAICLKAMSKSQDERYDTAILLANDIKRFLADEPVSAYPDPWTTRLGRWAKRHKHAVQVSAAVLVVVAGALAITSVVVSRERDQANTQRQLARQAVDDMYTRVAETWLENNDDQLQREFLTKARDYYVGFANAPANDVATRIEKGRAFARLGDVERKLGDPAKATTSYEQAITILEQVAATEPKAIYSLVRAQIGHGDALLASGQYEKAKSHYDEVIQRARSQRGNADLTAAQGLADRRLGDLLRTTGKAQEAEVAYKEAIELFQAEDLKTATFDTRRDLALAYDGLGLTLKQSGRVEEEERAHREAITLLESLVKRAPTAPQYREALARSANSLGLLMRETGASDESEALLKRQIALGERLSEDFPDRPDYRRALARASMNLGTVLRQLNKLPEAEARYLRALEIDETLGNEFTSVVDYRRDRARCLANLGEIAATNRKMKEAEAFDQRAISEFRKLVADAPEVPEYRGALAGALVNLGQLQSLTDRRAEGLTTYQESVALYDNLVGQHSQNPDYVRGLARVLGNVGTLLAKEKDPAASLTYSKAISAYETLVTLPKSRPADLADLATCLSNQADFLTQAKLSGAEQAADRSIEIQTKLVAEFPKIPSYRRSLAAVKINLGEWLEGQDRLADAERTSREGLNLLTGLAGEFPKNSTYQGDLGYVLNNLAKLATVAKRNDEARDLLERAVRADRAATDSSPNNAKLFKPQLCNHLESLAKAQLTVGGHLSAFQAADEFSRLGAEIPEIKACEHAARILVECIQVADTDALLSETRRSSLVATYADRAIGLLRESIERGDTDASRLVEDSAFAKLKDREAYKTLPIAGTDQPSGR